MTPWNFSNCSLHELHDSVPIFQRNILIISVPLLGFLLLCNSKHHSSCVLWTKNLHQFQVLNGIIQPGRGWDSWQNQGPSSYQHSEHFQYWPRSSPRCYHSSPSCYSQAHLLHHEEQHSQQAPVRSFNMYHFILGLYTKLKRVILEAKIKMISNYCGCHDCCAFLNQLMIDIWFI